MTSQTFNFAAVSALIVDDDGFAREIVTKILRSFGLSQQTLAYSGDEAKRLFEGGKRFELVLCEAVLQDMLGADLISWLRHRDDGETKYVPALVVTGHAKVQNIVAARDAGASGFVKKPIAPGKLFERIVWAASNGRSFVETDSYVGPDRRFRNLGPPNGVGRRATDLSATVGDAVEPNLSQSEVDSFLRPMRMTVE